MVSREAGRLAIAWPRMTKSTASGLVDLSCSLRRASMSTTRKPAARDKRPTIWSWTSRTSTRFLSNRSAHSSVFVGASISRALTRTRSPSAMTLPPMT